MKKLTNKQSDKVADPLVVGFGIVAVIIMIAAAVSAAIHSPWLK